MILMSKIIKGIDESASDDKILRTVGNDIICYHGSPNKFEKPRLVKSDLITSEDNLVEGLGIYCLNNKSLYDKYKYMYECYIKGSETDDLSSSKGINKWFNKFLKQFEKVTGMEKEMMFYALGGKKEFISDVINGRYKITESDFIRVTLDNNEYLYEFADDLCDWYDDNMIPKAFICKISGYKGLGIIIKDLSVITYWKMIKGE